MKVNGRIQVTAKAWMTNPFILVRSGEPSISNSKIAFRTEKGIDSNKRKEVKLRS